MYTRGARTHKIITAKTLSIKHFNNFEQQTSINRNEQKKTAKGTQQNRPQTRGRLFIMGFTLPTSRRGRPARAGKHRPKSVKEHLAKIYKHNTIQTLWAQRKISNRKRYKAYTHQSSILRRRVHTHIHTHSILHYTLHSP